MAYVQKTLDHLLDRPHAIQAAVDQLALSGLAERGAIFTKREVVEFILDLVEYTVERDLMKTKLLEPSFGAGDFLLVAAERLIEAYFRHGGTSRHIVHSLQSSLRAVELHRATFSATRNNLIDMLWERGISKDDAVQLVDSWLVQDDFLLTDLSEQFSHVVGNPPYVRQELIPDSLMQYYRAKYQTIYDRADLYVPFIERGLSLLSSDGKLAFICSDRWMKNRYGGPLRKIISECFYLQYYVDMSKVDAFQTNVTAYPAITVITRQRKAATRFASQPRIEATALRSLAKELHEGVQAHKSQIQELNLVVQGEEPWLLETSPSQLALIRRLEREFALLEDEGCKVGIGVATGCDEVFIGHKDQLLIEDDRKLPLVMSSDLRTGQIGWAGKVVINPFARDSKLVNLEGYPLLAAYFELHQDRIKNRNVAKKNPKSWYRTIDRIYEHLTYLPKLLIPDIKEQPLVVYDEGNYYPHHNLYFITSNQWDLRALQAVLRSFIAKLFVTMYSVKMRGGYLRFQAQYIRRIRLPAWSRVPSRLRERLIAAAISGNLGECDHAVLELYGVTPVERADLEAFGFIAG
jgi:hypothetical protein